jgi:outer membrane lipoprotein-sorting protein
MKRFTLFISLFLCTFFTKGYAQDIKELVKKAAAKIDQVNDYEASGTMRTDVTFLKVPVANVKAYFKKPGKLKLKSEKGLSFIPKGAVNLNLGGFLSNQAFTIIDAGSGKIGNKVVRVAKLLPVDDNSEIILSTLYIDPQTSLVQKAKTTTRENGSYELEMTYGKYAALGLPDKIIFLFDTKDYKLPKGITFDFDDGTKAKPKTGKSGKGKAEIIFREYKINKGISDTMFN